MQIRDASGSTRLAIGCFCVVLLSFGLLAQVNLWAQDGEGSLPTSDQVLWKYNGKPGTSRMHVVLDPDLPLDSMLNMSQFLGMEMEVDEARKTILDWVDAGAPESGWETVAPILTDPTRCAQCHVPGGQMASAPFETYADVVPYTQPDRGMAMGALLISAHNHLFGFAVSSLLLTLLLCHSRWGGWLRVGLILAAFAGPLLDIGGWFLTHYQGAPFQYMVILGGALFGGATTLMALLVLADTLRLGGAARAGGGA
ncbi:MAG: hypothetical protein QNJ98_16665 [Planctomycetota bacterium]|nr:hypothetical protein [Planctomycetota bacterium]